MNCTYNDSVNTFKILQSEVSRLKCSERKAFFLSQCTIDTILNGFISFILGRQPVIFRHVGSFCNKSPRKLRILEAKALTEMHGKCIEDLLKNVEIIEFEDCSFATDFYDSFLKYCLNLKQLVLKSFNECTHSGTKNRWLLHKYPRLELLSWSFNEEPPEELKTFFHRNPKVKSFAAARFPLEIIKLIMNGGHKFEELCLDIGFGVDLNMKQIFQSIELLHQQGQFKKLQMVPTTSMFVAAKFPPMQVWIPFSYI